MKENNWYIDGKNNFAHWHINGNTISNNSFWDELKSLLDIVFDYGNQSKLLYSNEYIIEPGKALIRELKHSKNNKCRGFCNEVNDSSLNNLIDTYQRGKITSKEINSLNIESILNEIEYYAIDEIPKFDFSLLSLSYDIDKDHGNFSIGLHVNSDIFFPYVLCPWKWKKKYDDNDEIGPERNELDYKLHGFDNRELSYRNGSRLNLLIEGVKSYVDNSDKIQWDFYETEHWLGYRRIVTDTGILLDKGSGYDSAPY